MNYSVSNLGGDNLSNQRDSKAVTMEREDAIFMAYAAEKAKRWKDVISYMKIVFEMEGDLSKDECRLILVGFKGLLENQRQSYKAIVVLENREQQRETERCNMVRDFKIVNFMK